jgi:hypothetical protein
MANAGSLLLPGSNLTNLLVLRSDRRADGDPPPLRLGLGLTSAPR